MNKLILDGKEYALSDELVAKLKESVAAQDWAKKNSDPFEAVNGKSFYYNNVYGGVSRGEDCGALVDKTMYAVANYCRDEEMMKQRALHETLNRLLWRYSETHGGDLPWSADGEDRHWCISIVLRDPVSVETDWVYHVKEPGVIYFKDRETVQSAIEEVVKPFLAEHPEFVW